MKTKSQKVTLMENKCKELKLKWVNRWKLNREM